MMRLRIIRQWHFRKHRPADKELMSRVFKDKDARVSSKTGARKSSDHLGPISPFYKRHFSASDFSTLAC